MRNHLCTVLGVKVRKTCVMSGPYHESLRISPITQFLGDLCNNIK